ncbi:MAG: 2-succinyl-5-enolpyruvyl-6-hydroxy-3-cyclohexene-1-carboxylic-acid synthase [Caldilineaceae bacterium]|nr:2-succinyl-5-enolpyruvyl-6-hydroxy-3-cyclohexene-1-carboxylic-acid synthase [Caldilineaceae bacterium]
MSQSSNPNLAWADRFVNELAACGLRAVCIAPGSRSTPLTLAFSRQPDINVYLQHDERSASFFALGLALATARPVALVCTSGTAAAEFHAAVIEAYQSQVPLLVLTADRPHEVRYSGANQTIDQVKMYGDHVLWSFDMALPANDAPALVLRSVQTMAARAYATANGLVKGPVHLNFPFRPPLEPAAPPLPTIEPLSRPAVRMTQGRMVPTAEQVNAIAAVVEQYERGLILCGPHCPGGAFPQALAALATATGYPILADPLSGVRFGVAVETGLVCGGYESYLRGGHAPWATPDIVIRFGAVPTSKWLNSYLTNHPPQHLIHIRDNGIWADDLHLVTDFVQADAAATCQALVEQLPARGGSAWTEAILSVESTSQQIVQQYCEEHFFDGAIVRAVVEALPAGTRLMIGNSLPVRHLDQFGQPDSRSLRIFGNRGASGIDGITSTALGIAAAGADPLVLITGDITFYHDMNGLLAIRQHNLRNVTIVLLNNDGGSIFRRLPVAKFEPPFTPLFLTPHGLDFRHVAQLYGIAYSKADDAAAFGDAIAHNMNGDQATIIEVQTDGETDLHHQQSLAQQIIERIMP